MPEPSHHISVMTILPLAVQSATVTSANFDLIEFDAFSILVTTGEIVGAGDFTATLQHADTASSANFIDVPTIDRIGTLPPSLTADAVVKLGYTGDKRYLRVVLTKNSGTSIEAGVVLIKGAARSRPLEPMLKSRFVGRPSS